MMLNLIIASLPAIIYIILFSLLDRKFIKKRFLILLLILIIGAIGSYICYRFEMHYGSYFKRVKDSTYLEVLFYAIFGVAIFEEGYKWLITFIIDLLDKYKSSFSIFIYSMFVSIGFAWFENIVYYAIPYGINTSISRMFTAFPSHICNAIWMGLFFTKYSDSTKSFKKYIYLILSLIVPILVHALYNSFLYGKDITLMSYHKIFVVIYFISSIVVLIIFLKKRIRKQSF